jgi:hypothetical protein
LEFNFGSVMLTSEKKSRRPLRLEDWLPALARADTESGADRRWQPGGGGRWMVGRDGWGDRFVVFVAFVLFVLFAAVP